MISKRILGEALGALLVPGLASGVLAAEPKHKVPQLASQVTDLGGNAAIN